MSLWRRAFRFRAWLGAGLLALAAPAALASDLETKVKAAYLFHLIKFVDWPSLPVGEIRLCILGSDAVGSMLGELANRQVRERRLRVEVDNVADPAQCQVLFLGRDEKRLPDLLRRLKGSSVLTVSDAEDFARRGGMVGFYAEAGKIMLEINAETARVANLRISSKLLELARTVP